MKTFQKGELNPKKYQEMLQKGMKKTSKYLFCKTLEKMLKFIMKSTLKT